MAVSRNRLLAAGNFLLGTFASNCSGGMSVTKVPERWDNHGHNNFGSRSCSTTPGSTSCCRSRAGSATAARPISTAAVLETMTWATGLLAQTQQITVFATIHTAANHPVVVAKQLATIDQISGGRVGLNIVAGWNKPEYEALGLDAAGRTRDAVTDTRRNGSISSRRSGPDGKFDWDGDYFRSRSATAIRVRHRERCRSSMPRDRAGPQVRRAQRQFPVHAGDRSGPFQGRRFAALKEQADRCGRAVEVLTFSHVVCRPTEKEATDYLAAFRPRACRLGCGR